MEYLQVSALSNKLLLQLLSYGDYDHDLYDYDLPSDVNKDVLELTLEFIHKTGRFD